MSPPRSLEAVGGRRPFRVVILTGLDLHAFRGGEKYAATLGKELAARGVEVTLFSKVDRNEPWRLTDDELSRSIAIPFTFYRLFWVPLLPPIPLAPIAFLRTLAERDTVFTLESTPRFTALVVFCARLLGRRVVVGLHHPSQADSLERELAGRGVGRLRARLFRFVLRSADAVHTINLAQAATLRRAGIFANVAMINSFVTADPVERPERGSFAVEALFVGPLEREQKGVDLLVDVARRVLGERRDWRLTIVGAGRDATLLTALRDEFPGRVRHLGFVPEDGLPRTYASADLLWLTSRAESFSLVAVEAYTQGVPVVSFDIPGLEDVSSILPDGRVPPFDTTAFASKVLELGDLARTQPERFEEIRRRCREGALSRFGAAVLVPELARMLGVPAPEPP